MRKFNALVVVSIVIVACLAGCESSLQKQPDTSASVSRSTFENPGGMWMPSQMNDHVEILEALGVQNPASLADPLSHPLGAIVWMGGCSASFVSPDGLIITNHHCAISSLQFNSTADKNLLELGFLAETRPDEVPMMTGGKVWVALDFKDITDDMTHGLEDIADDLARYKEIEKREKAILKECEQSGEGLRCRIGKYFGGQLYYLITQMEIKDVRLVYSPQKGIGFFGGEIDNWQWPRHTGDYSFFRAYVGPDGKPAEFSKDNVPYKPAHHLRVAQQPLKKGDFVMVAGYPGRTSRLKTADEAKFAVETAHPRRIYLMTEALKILKEISRQSEELKIKVTPSIFGYTNSIQYYTSLQQGLIKSDFVGDKKRTQDALEKWITEDSTHRKKYSGVLDKIEQINEKSRQTYMRDNIVNSLRSSVKMLSSAHTILRLAEERPKPDEDRDPSYQKRNWDRMIQRQQRMQKSYDRKVDLAMLKFYLTEAAKLPKPDRKMLLELIAPGKDSDNDKIMANLYNDNLTLEDPDHRVELLKTASLEDLKASTDPIMQLAIRIRPLTKQIEDSSKASAGAMALVRPRYTEALRAFKGSFVSPDANGTLRLTYGTVRGYRPKPDADVYEPFTTLPQLLAKDTGVEPFNSPEKLLAAAKAKQFGPYLSDELNELPVNFLSDVDTTGGNSGSATMDARGDLVGLLFDGNSESLASDWVFMPEITRSIHVDIRYVLWIMDYVDGTHTLLKEMGVKPNSKW